MRHFDVKTSYSALSPFFLLLLPIFISLLRPFGENGQMGNEIFRINWDHWVCWKKTKQYKTKKGQNKHPTSRSSSSVFTSSICPSL